MSDMQMKKQEEVQSKPIKKYHFPAIENISFLTEEEKVKLDNKLIIVRKGESIAGLREVTKDRSKQKEIEEWLGKQDMVQVTFAALCPICSELITDCMSEKEKEELQTLFATYKKEYNEEVEEKLRNICTNMCLDCEMLEDSNDVKELRFKNILQKK